MESTKDPVKETETFAPSMSPGFNASIFNALPVAVYTCDNKGYITYFNNAALKLWGRKPTLGNDRWCGGFKGYTEDGTLLSEDFCPYGQMINIGKVLPMDTFILERPDNTFVNVQPNPSLLYDTAGNVTGIINVLTDITAKNKEQHTSLNDAVNYKQISDSLEKTVEEKSLNLKKSEERYHRMIDEMQDYAILMLDPDGYILNWNKGAEKIKGYTEQEVIGQNFRIFYMDEDLAANLPETLIHKASVNGRAKNEGWRVRKGGTKFWAQVVITSMYDDNKNLIGFSKITRDLTERKLSDDRLAIYARDIEFRNKQLEEYAYIASHDLQEPLRKIQVFGEMLQESLNDPETIKRYLDKINASAARMTTLIKDVLKYSQLSSTEELFETTHLNIVLQYVLEDFDLALDQKKAIVNMTDLPAIKGIPIQLHQLFSNLISNAIKFSSANPVLTISAQSPSDQDFEKHQFLQPKLTYTKIIFKDNGQGFEQQYGDQVFKMFKRLGNTPGTGIGLALCKKITENHNGGISVSSQPGIGTEFSIFLPLV